jgi:hypothetical protein
VEQLQSIPQFQIYPIGLNSSVSIMNYHFTTGCQRQRVTPSGVANFARQPIDPTGVFFINTLPRALRIAFSVASMSSVSM